MSIKSDLFIPKSASLPQLLMAMLMAIALMVLDYRMQAVDSVHSILATVTYPLQWAVHLPRTIENWSHYQFAKPHQIIQENLQLQQENLLLLAKLQKMEALERDNHHLRQLLQSSARINNSVQVAELLTISTDPYKRQIVLNKGKQDGVFKGQPVLDAYGVMGQITRVNSLTSTAILITDRGHSLPVRINRNGLRSIVVGTGTQLAIPHLPNNADVKVGDLLVSSGLGGVFPPSYPVAVINAVKQDPSQSFAYITATPKAQIDTSWKLLLVESKHDNPH